MKILMTIINKNKSATDAVKNKVENSRGYFTPSFLQLQSRSWLVKRSQSESNTNNLIRNLTTREKWGTESLLTTVLKNTQTLTVRNNKSDSFVLMHQKFKSSIATSSSFSFSSEVKEVEGKVTEVSQQQVKALCLFGGAATLAAIWEVIMLQPYKLKGTEIVIISSPMWIEDINEKLWENQPWGQPLRYLPRAMRIIANDLYPDHSDEKPLTFKMIKDVIGKLRGLLKEAGIKIIENEVDAVKGSKEGLSITVNGAEKLIIPHHDYHVIHSGKKLSQIPGVKLNHFGNAYKKSIDELAQNPMVIVASGLNAIWAIRDFKGKSRLIYIIPKGDRELPMDDFDCVLRLEDAEFYATDEEDRIIIRGLCIKNNKVMTLDIHKHEIYSAKGFELSDVVQVDQTKMTLVDTSPKSEDLCQSYDLKGEKRFHTNDMRGTLVPPGNLASNCRAILSAISKVIDDNNGELILGDGQAVTSFNAWKEATLNKAKRQGVEIHEEFYKQVFSQIKSATTHFIPHDDQLWEVIKRLFNKGILIDGLLGPIKQPVAVNRIGKPIALSQFETIFRKPVQLVVVDGAEKGPKEADCEGVEFKR